LHAFVQWSIMVRWFVRSQQTSSLLCQPSSSHFLAAGAI
jgi:hypothetical protein